MSASQPPPSSRPAVSGDPEKTLRATAGEAAPPPAAPRTRPSSASASAGPEAELRGLLRQATIDPRTVARFLDGLDHAGRVAAIRATGRGEQRRLYAAVDGFESVALADLVPPGCAAMEGVRHFGKNTLPLFTHFEKRFCRPAEMDTARPSELYGFNYQTLAPITGPGYFVAVEAPERPEVWIDYRRVPGERPLDWPEIRGNESGLARLVYGFMVDTLRRVSEHVTIGSAARNGKDLGSWFMLCREPLDGLGA